MSLLNPKRILMTSPHHLGDFVAKVPFIRLLKKQFPAAKLFILGRNYIRELVELIEEVDGFDDFEVFFNQEEASIIQALKKLQIDVFIHILSLNQQIGPNAISYAQKAAIPFRIGNIYKSHWTLFKKRQFGLTHNIRKKRILPGVHEFEWNLFPLKYFGLNPDVKEISFAQLLRCSLSSKEPCHGIKPFKFNLILHPGSHGNAKEWPEKAFIQLITQLDPAFHILITGSREEKARFPIQSLSKKVTDLRGELSLKELIHLIAKADGLVAASTGPIHIASLFGTRTLALFPHQKEIGPQVWAPKGERSQILQSPTVCSACQKKLTDFNKALCRCMEGISVDQVQEVLEKWRSGESSI